MNSNQAPNIKHLVFDMGGVLVQIDWHGKVSEILGRDIPFNDIHALWSSSKAATDFENGRISFDDFAGKFITEQELSINVNQFQTAFMEIVQNDMPGICALLEHLQPHFTLSLLSNTNQPHFDLLKQRNSFLRYIENPFTSLGFGVMKPEAEIYRKLINVLMCTPEEVLFFDDGIANVEAARQVGIHAERVFGPEDIKIALQQYNCWPAA